VDGHPRIPKVIENPLTVSLRATWPLVEKLEFTGRNFIPALFAGSVFLTAIIVQAIFWPYGLIAVATHFLWGLVQNARDQIDETDDSVQAMPFTVALGIYFTMWVPCAFLCLPMYAIGSFGRMIAKSSPRGKD